MEQQGRLLTAKQAADVLAVSEGLVRKLLRTGVLPKVKVGRCTRVRRSDLEHIIALGTVPTLPRRGRAR